MRSFHDEELDSLRGQPLYKRGTCVSHVCIDGSEGGIALTKRRGEQTWKSLPVGGRSGMDMDFEHQSLAIHHKMALASFQAFGAIVASMGPPFSVVLTD